MYDHFLIIVPFHKAGHRIAWHKLLLEGKDYDYVDNVLSELESKVGELNLSSHIVSTETKDVQSIKEKDKFFSDIAFIENEEEFLFYYKSEVTLNASDVATFILSYGNDITHLKLQKLLYLCYEDFFIKYKKTLFDDKILAFPYGPVIKNVYDEYSEHGKNTIKFKEDDSVFFSKLDFKGTPSFSKILFSENGIIAMESILSTLKKHISKTAFDLVNITHKKGTPWSKVFQEKTFPKEITVNVIEEYVLELEKKYSKNY
ncbi:MULTISPECIES: Panacea domain-containing protein [Staphylococcus]|uniref:Panacea domain-containing protein n=1 Tax=Staphylococcus TaxID=1279 RepID=UPI000D1F6BDE|nr:type II toxin-antitoxin system antitoxin SocA domain-containing protein [Staphylococcus saprophyticus]PTJ64917.1 hypothetical protein BUZ77_11860 [Staphylococcus saprophyticus]